MTSWSSRSPICLAGRISTATIGRIRGVPGTGDVGTYSDIVVSVSDGKKTTSLPAFTVQVKSEAIPNAAPTIDGVTRQSISAEQTYDFTPTAADADGDPLTFLRQQPSHVGGVQQQHGSTVGDTARIHTSASMPISSSRSATARRPRRCRRSQSRSPAPHRGAKARHPRIRRRRLIRPRRPTRRRRSAARRRPPFNKGSRTRLHRPRAMATATD